MITDPVRNVDARTPAHRRRYYHMRVLRGVSNAVNVGDILAPGAWREAEEEDCWNIRTSLRLSLSLPCNVETGVVQ